MNLKTVSVHALKTAAIQWSLCLRRSTAYHTQLAKDMRAQLSSGSQQFSDTRGVFRKGMVFILLSLSDCTGLPFSPHFLPTIINKWLSTKKKIQKTFTFPSLSQMHCYLWLWNFYFPKISVLSHISDSCTELWFVLEKPIHMYTYDVLPNILAKFHDNLHTSENQYMGKEAWNVINTSWLKLLCKNAVKLQFIQFGLQFFWSTTDFTKRNGNSKILRVFVVWLQILNFILKFLAQESVTSIVWTL
jgi:hypothetical protein